MSPRVGGTRIAAVVAAVVGVTWVTVAAARAESPASVRRFALVIGTNDGGADRVALRYAERDARAFSAVMEQLGGVRPADRVLLEGADAKTILAALTALDAAIRSAPAGHRRTELLVYYSGHSDELGLLLGDERLAYPELRRAIEGVAADVKIAVLDSCASGALLRKKGGRRVAPFLVDESNEVSGRAFLTSSSADEVAQESDRLKGSFFTHHLLTGLRGAADASGDGRVTLSEAYHFAFRETLARTEHTQSGPQHANYDFDLKGTGDVVMTDLSRVSGGLSLAADLRGHFFIRDAAERLVAEVRKTTDRPVELALGAGRYSVRYTVGEDVLGASVVVGEGSGRELDRAAFARIAAASRHQARGPEGLSTTEAASGDLSRPADDELEVVGARFAFVPGFGSHGSGARQRVEGVDFGLLGDYVAEVEGLQLSGLFNVSGGRVDGAQISAVTNVAGDVDGVQIGLVNVAGHVRGAQIGLINVADRVDGTSLGLLPIVADGYNHLEAWADSGVPFNLGFRLGAPYAHVLANVGVSDLALGDACTLRIGGGVGTHIPLGPVYLDVDGTVHLVAEGGCEPAALSTDFVTSQLRVSLGLPLTGGLAVFIGVGGRLDLRNRPAGPDNDVSDDRQGAAGSTRSVDASPTVFAGVRLF